MTAPLASVPPCAEDAARSVFERVHAVLSELPAIGKDQRAPQAMGGYAFRGIEDITAALKPLLAKHGVFMVPTVVERRDETRSTSGGKALYVADVLVRFTFHAGGDTSFSAEVWGQGTDSGDKAVQKAMTSAFKTMLSITFCISDSEYDAERHDVPDTTPPPASPDRVSRLADEVKKAGIGDWVKEQSFVWPWTSEACDAIEAKLAEPM